MRHRRKPARTFESLENRSMLAGNVTAAVDGSGNLTITGDAKANTIYIAETSSGGWRIQGLSTKINGHSKIFVTAPVTGNVSVDMGDGDDQFFMQDGTVAGDVSVSMGAGKNTAALWNLDIALLHFDSGDLNDHLWIDNIVASDQGSSIDTQAGKDTVTINHFTAPDLQISLGAGNDSLTLKNTLVSGGSSPQLQIDAGADRDSVSLSKVKTGDLEVEMGAGNKDSLSISQSAFDTGDLLDTAGTKGSISGTGNTGINGQPISSLTIDPNFTHHTGNFTHDIV
jgi:hypothetical protein